MKTFIKDGDIDDSANYKELFLDHIEHISKIVGTYDVIIASDDMNFLNDIDSHYGDLAVYDYSKINKELFFDLVSRFGLKNAYAISYNNIKNKIFNKLKNNRESKKIGVR